MNPYKNNKIDGQFLKVPREKWKYDLGSGVTKVVTKLRIKPGYVTNDTRFKDFTLQGSNNNSDWDTIYTGQVVENSVAWQDFTFSNSIAYRYYMLHGTTSWNIGAGSWWSIWEIEMRMPIHMIILIELLSFILIVQS